MNAVISCSRFHKRYYRLIALGMVDVVLCLPIGIICLIASLKQGPVDFWPGWSTIHTHSPPLELSSADCKDHVWTRYFSIWNKYTNVGFGVGFFLLFGLTSDARETYRQAFKASMIFIGLGAKTMKRDNLSPMFGSENSSSLGTIACSE